MVKDGAKVTIIPVENFHCVEAQDHYVLIVSGGRKLLKQQTISSHEKMLNPAISLRLHRSAIVNVERMAGIEPYTNDSRPAILIDGTRLPFRRAGYASPKALVGGRI